MGDLVTVASEMSHAQGALQSAGKQLLAIADARRDLASLVDSSPSQELRRAVERVLERWELVVWDTGRELEALARDVRRTAEGFERVERILRGGPFFETPWVMAR